MCAHRTRRIPSFQLLSTRGSDRLPTPSSTGLRPWLATGRRLAVAVLLAALGTTLLATAASAQSLETTAADWKALGETPEGTFGEGRLQVLRGAEGWLLSDGDGDQLALPWPANSVPYDLERQGSYWWASATEMGDQGLRPVVIAGQGDQMRRLAAPTVGARVARDPVLLVDAHGLRALVWFEGTSVRTLRPRAAKWHGTGWDPAVDLAPVGPGTQIALTATILADGSWLAAWAAYDGHDDEILWSRAVDGRWSAAQPVALGNDVPDITPHLQAVDGGALIAWSRFDGSTYRVQLARFLDGAWTLPRTLGARGTGQPRFLPGATPLLAYKHGHPRAWTVVELEPTGKPRRSAYATTQHTGHPRLQERSADQLRLVWDTAEGPSTDDATVTLRWQDAALSQGSAPGVSGTPER